MGRRVERTRNAGTLTESQYFGMISSALRRKFQYWKPMTLALEKASRVYKGVGRHKKEYICAFCNKWYKRSGVEIDHKIPCGSLKCYDDIGGVVERLTSENIDDYQVLCKKCHLDKTTQEKRNKKIA